MSRSQAVLLLGLLAGAIGAAYWAARDRPSSPEIRAATPDPLQEPGDSPEPAANLAPIRSSVPQAVETPAVDEVQSESELAAFLRAKHPGRFGEKSDEELLAIVDLDLRGAKVTDADLALLRHLPNLKHLSLYGNPVTDAGLVHLGGLTKLETVTLRGTEVTGAGLQHLPTQNLTALHLCDSNISAEDLAHTPIMPRLEKLKLNFMGFEDGVIERLDVYPSLRHIELDQAKITDAGLARLLELNPGLLRVEIRDTPVSAKAIAQLQEIYPDCDFATQ